MGKFVCSAAVLFVETRLIAFLPMNDSTKSAKINVVSIRVIRVPVVSLLEQNKIRSASPEILKQALNNTFSIYTIFEHQP